MPIQLAGILLPCLRYRASNEVKLQAMQHMLEIIRILKGTKLLSVSCLSDPLLLCHDFLFYFFRVYLVSHIASEPMSLRLVFEKFLFGYKLQIFEPSAAIADSGLPNLLTRTFASLDALPSLPHRDMIFLTQHRYTDIIATYVG